MPSEISQSQKDKFCMIPFMRVTQNSQIQRDIMQNGDCQGLGEGRMKSCCLIRTIWEDEQVLEMDGGDSWLNNVNVLNATELYANNG